MNINQEHQTSQVNMVLACRLLYCEAPPGLDQAAYHTHPREVRPMLVLTLEMLFLGEARLQGREREGVGSETVATHQVKVIGVGANI